MHIVFYASSLSWQFRESSRKHTNLLIRIQYPDNLVFKAWIDQSCLFLVLSKWRRLLTISLQMVQFLPIIRAKMKKQLEKISGHNLRKQEFVDTEK